VAQYFVLHPANPQPRLIRQAAEILRDGGVIAYPTDSSYALGCGLGHYEAVRRIRDIRGVDEHHHLTLVLREPRRARSLRAPGQLAVPAGPPRRAGPFTFILPATREVPKRLIHPKRSTVGVRCPSIRRAGAADRARGAAAVVDAAPARRRGAAQRSGGDRARLEKRLDAILDAGACPAEPTTVLDLAVDPPAVCGAVAAIRRGWGLPPIDNSRCGSRVQ